MFYDTSATVLNGSFIETGQLVCDIQPINQSTVFEDNIEIESTCRAFCPVGAALSLEDYLLVGDALYKIMQIKHWDDYRELLLYLCERSIP